MNRRFIATVFNFRVADRHKKGEPLQQADSPQITIYLATLDSKPSAVKNALNGTNSSASYFSLYA